MTFDDILMVLLMNYVPHRTILNYYENIVNNIVNEGGSFITSEKW